MKNKNTKTRNFPGDYHTIISNNTTDGSIIINSTVINRKQYEEDLERRQKEHLENIFNKQNQNWRPCIHDSCPECVGTGIRKDGSHCVHHISCPCPKCTPSYF
jgi:hypothetical protein